MPSGQIYKVKKGDTLQAVAKQLKIPKWETIWSASENKSLVAKRRKPELIQPGDQLTIPDKDAKEAGAKKDEKGYEVVINGKKVVLPEAEFEKIKSELSSALNKNLIGALQRRVDVARASWDILENLQNQHKVISWFMSSVGGPKLPPESIITAAEQSVSKLKSAISAGKFDRVYNEMGTTEDVVSKAARAMSEYRTAVFKRADVWDKNIEFAADKTETAVKLLASATFAKTPAAQAAVGAAIGLAKSAGSELGKYSAGVPMDGAAVTKHIVLGTVLGALDGSADKFLKGKAATRTIEGVAKAAAKKIGGSKWLGSVSAATLEKFLANRLEGAAEGAYKSAIANGMKLLNSDTTPEKFFEQVAEDTLTSSALVELNHWIDNKMAHNVYDHLAKAAPELAKLPKAKVLKAIASVTQKSAAAKFKKALEITIGAAKGHETVEQLGALTVKEFTKSDMDGFKDQIVKAAGL